MLAPIRIFLLNPPQTMRSCLAGWRDIFNLANRIRQRGDLPPLYQTRIISVSPRGLANLSRCAPPEICLAPVMLGEKFPDCANSQLLEILRNWHLQGVLLGSACAGSFLFAAAGLLDGRRATTHWSLAQAFAAAFPKVHLDIGELLVENAAGPLNRPGGLLCGAGITAYIDLAMAIITKTGGKELATQLGRTLLWDPHRPQQSAFAAATDLVPLTDELVLRAQAWAMTHLGHNFTLSDWAQAQGLELRSFERRFARSLTQTPGLWLRRQRLQAARELLATSQRSWREICIHCGYADSGNFRAQFQQEFGLSPREYRQRFQQS